MNPTPPLYNDAGLRTTPARAVAVAVAHDVDAAHRSAVSWGAILAGAAGAAALSLILLMLGAGLGLSSVSPFSGQGAGAAAFGISTILWLTVTQLLASGMGGYLAGRLRTRWTATHADEVYFSDTAHGFLAWAIASLATAALLTSVVGAIVGTGVQAGAALTGSTAATVAVAEPKAAVTDRASSGPASAANVDGVALGYFVDTLFRTGPANAASASPAADTAQASAPAGQPAQQVPAVQPGMGGQQGSHSEGMATGGRSSAEVAAILTHALAGGALPQEDKRHIAALVATRTGLTQTDAESRVSSTYQKLQNELESQQQQVREAADKARKASSHAMLWIFISLLAGAFVASLFATFGGRRRDL